MSKKLTIGQDPNFAYLLGSGLRWVEAGSRLQLDELKGIPELTLTQWMLMANLDRDGTSISEVARRLGVSRQAAHQTIGELSKLKLLEVIPDATDKRAKLAQLSAGGRKMDDAVVQGIWAIEEGLKERIGSKNSEALRVALEAMLQPVEPR
jgi:DNA-binding MarR family transcriptional regulator